MSKQFFLSLNRELLLHGYNHRLKLTKEEERVLNYRNGIRAAIKSETNLSEEPFFDQLQSMYEGSKIPLLSSSTSFELFKRYSRNKAVFSCLIYLSKKLGASKLVDSPVYWDLVIQHINLNAKDTLESKKTALNLLVLLSRKLLNSENTERFINLFKFILNNTTDGIYACLQRYELGVNIRGHQINWAEPIAIKKLFHLFTYLQKQNASPAAFEFLCIELVPHVNEKLFVEEGDLFVEFIIQLYEYITIERLFTLNFQSLTTLYSIYRLNPSVFEKVDYEIINEKFEDKWQDKALDFYRFHVYSSILIEDLFRSWGISIYFTCNFIGGRLSYSEEQWLNELIRGGNLVYTKDLPFTVSKKLAHVFNTLPGTFDDSSIQGTVTEGLIKTALFEHTGDLNYVLYVHRFIRNVNESEFWIKTAMFLHRQGLRVETGGIGELFDYIRYQVFTLNRTIDFSKKKLRNLQQDVEAWHAELNNARRYGHQGLVKLPDYGITTYSHEKQGKHYIIKQLKTNKELIEEGAALKHCVGLYTSHCLQHGSFIFSLRELKVNEQEETEEIRCITIELNRNRIIQKKGHYNRSCKAFELAIISAWMREYKIAC
ncbi:MAG: hypothetical protein RLZZ382_1549 [Bacteroidota bacterium]